MIPKRILWRWFSKEFQTRTTISLARQSHYFSVMQTVTYAFTGLTAITVFGGKGTSVPISAVVLLVTVFGVLAGNTALNDIANLIDDLDDAARKTHFGKGVLARNMAMLKAASATIVLLAGLSLLFANVV